MSETSYRLRSSVSVVSRKENHIIEFFQSNTRRIKHVKVKNYKYFDLVSKLDGKSINELKEEYAEISEDIEVFINALHKWCLIEDAKVGVLIEKSSHYRVYNFLGDFITSDDIFDCFRKIQSSHVVIIGAGGVGSWIADGLMQTGVKHLTIVDPDYVKVDNLNRSLFVKSDIGNLKTVAIKQKAKRLPFEIQIDEINSMICSKSDAESILASIGTFDLLINAADHPNVDTTSSWLFPYCMMRRVPHIVAGGYNLHLSLIGPTIIPYESACFNCIKLGLERQQTEDFSRIRKLERKNRNIGNLAPLAGISASFTISEAIRVLCKDYRLLPEMINKRAEYNFINSKILKSNFDKDKDCTWCNIQKTDNQKVG